MMLGLGQVTTDTTMAPASWWGWALVGFAFIYFLKPYDKRQRREG